MTAQGFDALRTPLIKGERRITHQKRRQLVQDTHSYAIPAWFVVGAAVAIPVGLWILGLGLGTDGKLTSRPRFDPSFKLL